uniref:Tripartite tricarboxylate transporter TctB family protein n=1 Tax=Alloyangia mangrovi TaxID=1779329 RepID=A0A2A3JZN8_9RHOB
MSRRPEETAAAPAPVPVPAGRWNLWIGLGTLAFVALCLLAWFPRDIGSGFLQTNLTGRTVPGDSFFPILLVGLMVPLAALLILSQLGTARGADGEEVGSLGPANLGFLGRSLLLTAVSLLVMNWTGPALVWLTNALGLTAFSGYRAASASFPFDVSGFLVGGTLLTCGFIRITCHRLRMSDVLVAAATVAVMILIFDGLLENIQLPPNADL